MKSGYTDSYFPFWEGILKKSSHFGEDMLFSWCHGGYSIDLLWSKYNRLNLQEVRSGANCPSMDLKDGGWRHGDSLFQQNEVKLDIRAQGVLTFPEL